MRALPRWLAPALGLWLVVAAVTLANATAVPVPVAVVALLLGGIAVAHGAVHRRWFLAGPLATVLLAGAGAAAAGWLTILDLSYHGPAGTTAPKLIWAALSAVVTLEIGWGLRLHARVRHVRTAALSYPDVTALDEALGALNQRLGRVEDLITRVD